jgi:hypothetical protein
MAFGIKVPKHYWKMGLLYEKTIGFWNLMADLGVGLMPVNP